MQDAAICTPSACHACACLMATFTSGRASAGISSSGVPVASAGMITQSGFKFGVIGTTGNVRPRAVRTFFRTPTSDTSKRGAPPIIRPAKRSARDNASSAAVNPVSKTPSRASTASFMA